MIGNIDARALPRADPWATRPDLAVGAFQLVQAALDALPAAVFVVEAGMCVIHANISAIRMTSRTTFALSMTSDRSQPRDVVLLARQKDDHVRLRHMVGRVAGGGPGGALRLRCRGKDKDSQSHLHSAIVKINPVIVNACETWPPTRGQALPGVAVIVARDPACLPAPPAELMMELYGLSRAEAEVASHLAGAATANHVARNRGVSLETIRSQIKMILHKTNTANLRDLERLMALTSTVHQPD